MPIVLFLLVLSVIVAPIAAVFAAPAPVSGPFLVVFAPWDDPEALVARAGGVTVGPTRALIATLAQSDDAEFVDRLRREGAVAVMDGENFARLCSDL